MKTKLTLLIICLFSISLQAQDAQKLDAYFSTLAKANKFMGQVTLSQNGKTPTANQNHRSIKTPNLGLDPSQKHLPPQ